MTGYDDILDIYQAHIERPDSWNSLYERPAFKALLPPLAGKRVLDLGCASGYYIDYAFAHEAASVTAVDIARGWLDRIHARRQAPNLRLVQADIGQPMPFLDDDSFDVIIASLVIHYVREWGPMLAELYRVLAPGGRVIISTHHPFLTSKLHPGHALGEVFEVEDTWGKAEGKPFQVRFWSRSLTETLRPFIASPFHIVDILEPPPEARVEAIDPEAYRRFLTEPTFLFIVLEKP